VKLVEGSGIVNVRKGILRAESVVESAILLRAGACEKPFGAVMEVRIWFVRGNTSTCVSKSQELRLFGKAIKTSWRESVDDLLTHFPTVWH
jgi:hypothetical protein